MLTPIVVVPYDDHAMVFSRVSNKYLRVELALYELLRLLSAAGSHQLVPEPVAQLFQSALSVNVTSMTIDDAFVLRQKSQHGFGVASWELNLLCNYSCPHCYLGERPNDSMTLSQRLTVIDRMVELGITRLQMTGGEPLVDRHFAETYAAAYDRGIIVTVSTNGSWLRLARVQSLFRTRPPLRVTVSLYGATAESYEAMTRAPKGSFARYLEGLRTTVENGIALRVNIIVSTFNAHELDAMKALAAQYTNDWHVYDQMTATIHGDANPLDFQADGSTKRPQASKAPFTGCQAGIASFHVDPMGRATMCKLGRDTHVLLHAEPAEAMHRLAEPSRAALKPEGACTSCALQQACVTCPLVVKQYRLAGAAPSAFCLASQ